MRHTGVTEKSWNIEGSQGHETHKRHWQGHETNRGPKVIIHTRVINESWDLWQYRGSSQGQGTRRGEKRSWYTRVPRSWCTQGSSSSHETYCTGVTERSWDTEGLLKSNEVMKHTRVTRPWDSQWSLKGHEIHGCIKMSWDTGVKR